MRRSPSRTPLRRSRLRTGTDRCQVVLDAVHACTSCQAEQAGNVWVVTNWKPGFATDFDPNGGDPGGDGT